MNSQKRFFIILTAILTIFSASLFFLLTRYLLELEPTTSLFFNIIFYFIIFIVNFIIAYVAIRIYFKHKKIN